MKENYDAKMVELIKTLHTRPKLLLHTCCAPCSTAVIKRLEKFFDLTILYYNPNIEPKNEYLKRKEEQLKYLKKLRLPFIDIDYENSLYRKEVVGLEKEKEGKARCLVCFHLRLKKTAQVAALFKFPYFCSTLTVSPHKNSQIINKIGKELENENVKWLYSDFKKNEGYKISIELSKENDLYRQNYCGCEFSKKEKKDEN